MGGAGGWVGQLPGCWVGRSVVAWRPGCLVAGLLGCSEAWLLVCWIVWVLCRMIAWFWSISWWVYRLVGGCLVWVTSCVVCVAALLLDGLVAWWPSCPFYSWLSRWMVGIRLCGCVVALLASWLASWPAGRKTCGNGSSVFWRTLHVADSADA